MCDPITMATVAAIGKASEISATNQAAEAAQDAAIDQQMIMNAQRVQEMEDVNRKAGMELTQQKRESLREQATARTASAESGAIGGVALRNLANVYMQDGINSGSIVALSESELAQIGTQSQADFLSTRSTINQAEAKKSTGLDAALQIGVASGTAYASSGGFEGGTLGAGTINTPGYVPKTSSWDAAKTGFRKTWGFN